MAKYDASAIEVIENLEAIRKRPGMYIGDTGTRGLHHLVKEIVDNSVDEYLAGHASVILITLSADNTATIEDDGRGIPVGIHSKTKKPAIETIFTTLHSGGKFGGENSGYKVSGGLHGVGSSVVNALSSKVKVTVWKNKSEYIIEFHNGGKLSKKLTKVGTTNKTGTKVEFKPDDKIFPTININGKIIAQRLRELAYLNPDLEIKFNDKKIEQQYDFSFPGGLSEWVNELSEGQKEVSKVHSFTVKSAKITFNAAIKYTGATQENIQSFVNNIITPEGGSHETAFKTALTKAVNDYALNNKLQEGGKPLDGDDVREGLYAIISVYVTEDLLQFEGQTKSKLASPKARTYIEREAYNQLVHYLNSNKTDAHNIIKRAYSSKKAREAAKRAREVTRELNKTKGKSYVGKLVIAQSRIPEKRELFVVEGDSAGGSAKLGRNRKTQAILPLKGKIVNTEKANLKTILANEELSILIASIGGGLGEDFRRKKVNYGKIIIMTDADTDGAHIQALLLTFFYRFMKELIDEGMVYIAMPPLYKVTNKTTKKIQYAWSDDELKKIREGSKNTEIQRYKGLGEMNSEQLWETTMDPKTRTLVQVDASDAEAASKIIEILMGQDPAVRRQWIENNVVFTLEDNFIETINTQTEEVEND